jgi:serine/threonine protein kinase
MSTTRTISLALKKFNTLAMVELEDIPIAIPSGGFSLLTKVKKVKNFNYSLSKPGNTQPVALPLIVVSSEKKEEKYSESIQSQDLIAATKVPSQFRHCYLYRDDKGVFVSLKATHGDLMEYINDHVETYDLADAIRLASQVLLMVNDFHKHNLVHRDIKLENILVSEIDGKLFLKLADLDEVVKTGQQGITESDDVSEIITPECGVPELRKTSRYSFSYRFLNWKSIDCYLTGITLYTIFYMLLKKDIWGTLFMVVGKEIQWKVLNDNSPQQFVIEIIKGLIEENPGFRKTIAEVMSNRLFGETVELRNEYFNDLREEANFILKINDNEVTLDVPPLNDASLLLDHSIQKIYQSGISLAEEIQTCEASIARHHVQYSNLSPTIEKVIQLKEHAKELIQSIHTVQQTSQNQYFLTQSSELEVAIFDSIKNMNAKFPDWYGFNLQKTLVQSIEDEMKLINAGKNTLFSSLNVDNKAEMVELSSSLSH